MFARLRSGSALRNWLILLLLLGLVIFVVVERQQSRNLDKRVYLTNESSALARELSLYVQYNAHDTNAYTLGHVEHRQEYAEHRETFQSLVGKLQTRINEGVLHEDDQRVLDRIKQTREEYDRASERLFAAADANRKNPSEENQAKEDAAWEVADELGDQLDTQSQQLANNINAEVERIQNALDRRSDLAILLTLGLGAAIAALILLIQRRVAKAEKAQASLASIVENSRDAIDSKTPDGTILSVNPSAERLYGYSEEEIKGKDFSIFTPPEHLDEMIEIFQRVVQGETISEYETMRVSKEGRRIPLALTISPVRNSANEIVAVSAIARDITERKVAEQELKQAKEAADQASSAKSEFLANMSHEIRTPMNGVIGMTGLLLDTDLSPQQREYAETVRASGENLLAILNDILDFSKIEAGRMELEVTDFDLGMVVEEALGLFAERAHAKGLELASLIEHDVPTALRGDPGRLTQILTNLLGNAIKFTEEGEVVLCVSLAEERDEDAVVRFEVRDTGIGITSEQRERLFRSFSQADTSTTRRYGGTGLGLAISRQLVELMGGEIRVESEPRVGSTFFFEIPLAGSPEGIQIETTPRTDLRSLRVLVVDDNDTNRKIVHHQIISWGMTNGMAEDGPQALRMLRSAAHEDGPYDLVILDMQMPDMDGMELARRIKGEPAIAATRLIMLTSLGRDVDADEMRLAGIEACLTKPVRQSRLYDAIVTVTGVSEEAPPVEVQPASPDNAREEPVSSGARVLVTEDNSVNQKVAVRMLEKLGYRADVAADGLEALEALSRVAYAAILMDVQMPEMDGYEATAEIRRREGDDEHRTPIIAMTANAMQGDREKALAAGMDDYVPKPVKLEELGAVLRRWVPPAEDAAVTTGEGRNAPIAPERTGGTIDRPALEEEKDRGS